MLCCLRTFKGEDCITYLPMMPTSPRPKNSPGNAPPSTFRVAADVQKLAEIRRFVEVSADAMQVDPTVRREIVLAVDEAATNIIQHGYQGHPGYIDIVVERQGDSFVVHIYDQAPPFDPTQVPAPDLTLQLEERPIGKLGVYLIKHFMDDVIYETSPQGGNHLILMKDYFNSNTREENSNDHND
jgi:anti-sigma regulatory factor (Ser/Thr protein kinase)